MMGTQTISNEQALGRAKRKRSETAGKNKFNPTTPSARIVVTPSGKWSDEVTKGTRQERRKAEARDKKLNRVRAALP